MRDGHYTVTLNFGTTPFTGSARWLQIARRNGSSTGGFTVAGPRELLTGTPYALSVRPGMQITGDVPQPGRGIIRADNTGSGVGLWGRQSIMLGCTASRTRVPASGASAIAGLASTARARRGRRLGRQHQL